MKTVHRKSGWWIVDPPPGVEEMGPYSTRREAEEDRVGVERFLRNREKEDFITMDQSEKAKN